METLSQKLNQVATEVGKIKTLNELEEYWTSLPRALQQNGLLLNLFSKRRIKLQGT